MFRINKTCQTNFYVINFISLKVLSQYHALEDRPQELAPQDLAVLQDLATEKLPYSTLLHLREHTHTHTHTQIN